MTWPGIQAINVRGDPFLAHQMLFPLTFQPEASGQVFSFILCCLVPSIQVEIKGAAHSEVNIRRRRRNGSHEYLSVHSPRASIWPTLFSRHSCAFGEVPQFLGQFAKKQWPTDLAENNFHDSDSCLNKVYHVVRICKNWFKNNVWMLYAALHSSLLFNDLLEESRPFFSKNLFYVAFNTYSGGQ